VNHVPIWLQYNDPRGSKLGLVDVIDDAKPRHDNQRSYLYRLWKETTGGISSFHHVANQGKLIN
jgi:hypothetical protein